LQRGKIGAQIIYPYNYQFRDRKEECEMRKWECVICGFIYDEEKGLPEEGIAPGTKWDDVPDDWECPECGVSKFDFEMVEAAA
jgi:rubredoxin